MVYAREDMMRSTIHPIVSWSHGMGLKKESLFIGTRDYSALLSSAAAIKYLQGSAKGIETRNRDSVLRYSKMLREAWGKSHSLFLSLSLPSLSFSLKQKTSSSSLQVQKKHNPTKVYAVLQWFNSLTILS